jgi:hypothetical protein
MKIDVYLREYLAEFFVEWETFRTRVVEKIQTLILCSTVFSPPKIVQFMRYCGKKKIRYTQTGHTWEYNTAHAHCMLERATDTHSEYVITIPFPRQQWLRERASVLRYTYRAVLNRTVMQLSGNKSMSAVQSVSQSWCQFLVGSHSQISSKSVDKHCLDCHEASSLTRGQVCTLSAHVICSDIQMYIIWFQSCLLHIYKSFLCISTVKYIHSLRQSSPYEFYHALSCSSESTTAT